MPDFWIRFDCGIIDMNCTDPTALETSHLQYTFDGFHEEFSLLNVLEGVFNLCLHLTTSRSYQVRILTGVYFYRGIELSPGMIFPVI